MSSVPTWRSYGGLNNLENTNNLNVNNISAGYLTLRNAYSGLFTVSGDIIVKGDSTMANNCSVGGDLSVSGNIDVSGTFLARSTARIYDNLYMGTSSAFFYGSGENIAINGVNPQAALDITSFGEECLDLYSSNSTTRNILARNNAAKGITTSANATSSSIQFYADTPISSISVPGDAALTCSVGGNLDISASGSVNLKSFTSISTGIDSAHIRPDTLVIYDISGEAYLRPLFSISSATSGNALSLVATTNIDNTAAAIITPSGLGMGLVGGSYPGDSSRAMAAIGLYDTNGAYTETQMIVSGSSATKLRTSMGINTCVPTIDVCALEVNGPLHIHHGEVISVLDAPIEITAISMRKGSQNNSLGIAVGSPQKLNLSGSSYSYGIYNTTDHGETWTKASVDPVSANLTIRCVYMYDDTYAIAGGDDGLVLISCDGGITWTHLFGTTITGEITSVGIFTTANPSYYYSGIQQIVVVLACLDKLYFFQTDSVYDISDLMAGSATLPYLEDTPVCTSIYTLTSGVGFITCMDAYEENYLFISGTGGLQKISMTLNATLATVSATSYVYTSPELLFSAGTVVNSSVVYNRVRTLYESEFSVFPGNDAISYTMDGTTILDSDVSSITIYGTTEFVSVHILDTSRAIAVGIRQGIYFLCCTADGAVSWNIISNSVLDANGYAFSLIENPVSLSAIYTTDINTFSVAAVYSEYASTSTLISNGETKIFQCFFPEIFNGDAYEVLQVRGYSTFTGNMDISGNMAVAGNAAISGNAAIAGNFTSVGNALVSGTLTASKLFTASLDATINGNLAVGLDSALSGNLVVSKLFTARKDSVLTGNLTVGTDTALSGNLTVSKLFTASKDSVLTGNLTVGADTALSGNLTVSKLFTASKDSVLTGNLTVGTNTALSGNLALTGYFTATSDATFSGNTIVGGISRATYTDCLLTDSTSTINIGSGSKIINIAPSSSAISKTVNISRGSGSAANQINIGRAIDSLLLTGSISLAGAVKATAGSIQLLSEASGSGNSAGSGLFIRDGNSDTAGFIQTNPTMNGFLLKSANNTNALNFNIANLALGTDSTTGNTMTRGIVMFRKTTIGDTTSTYTIDTSLIDASSIMLKNYSLSSGMTNTQVLSSDVGITGNLSVSNTASTTGAGTGALIVSGGTAIGENLYVSGNVAIGGTLTLNTGGLAFTNNVFFSYNQSATSSITGTVSLAGGIGTGGNNYLGGSTTFAGQAKATATTASTSATTGALVVSGGAGILGNLNVAGAVSNTGYATFSGGALFSGTTTFSAPAIHSASVGITSTSTATSILSGALTVSGGTGISGNLYVGESAVITGNCSMISSGSSTSIGTGALTVAGGVGVGENAYIGGNAIIKSLTDSSSASTGALIVSGGIGVAASATIGGNIDVAGNVSITNIGFFRKISETITGVQIDSTTGTIIYVDYSANGAVIYVNRNSSGKYIMGNITCMITNVPASFTYKTYTISVIIPTANCYGGTPACITSVNVNNSSATILFNGGFQNNLITYGTVVVQQLSVIITSSATTPTHVISSIGSYY